MTQRVDVTRQPQQPGLGLSIGTERAMQTRCGRNEDGCLHTVDAVDLRPSRASDAADRLIKRDVSIAYRRLSHAY